MINIRPLNFKRPTANLQAFSDTVDRINERYYEGESLTQESKDLFGLLDVAEGDIANRNQYAQEVSDKLDSLLDQYEGAYESRAFQNEAKRLVRESQQDPRLKIFQQTAIQNKAAKEARLKSQLDPSSKLIFDNNEPISSYQDENGNWRAGQFKGEFQADYIGKAKEIMGTIAQDAKSGVDIGSFNEILNGIKKTGIAGVSQDKLNKLSSLLAKPFLETPEGDQWLRYPEDIMGRELSPEEAIVGAADFIVSSNSNQLSRKTSVDWNFPEFLNRGYGKQPEETQANQEYSLNNIKYNSTWSEDNKAIPEKLSLFKAPDLSLSRVQDFVSSFIRTNKERLEPIFNSKEYQDRVTYGSEVLMGVYAKQLVEKLNSDEDVEKVLSELEIEGLDREWLSSNFDLNQEDLQGEGIREGLDKSMKKALKNIKTVEDLYRSPLGLAIEEKAAEQLSTIIENFIYTTLDTDKEKHYKDKENISNRFKGNKRVFELNNQSIEELDQDDINSIDLSADADDEGRLLYKGTVNPNSIIAGLNPSIIGADVFESADGKEYLVQSAKPIGNRERLVADSYAKLKTNPGREVVLNNGLVGKTIASRKQFELALEEYSIFLRNNSNITEEHLYEIREKARMSYSDNNIVLIKDRQGNKQLIPINNLLKTF